MTCCLTGLIHFTSVTVSTKTVENAVATKCFPRLVCKFVYVACCVLRTYSIQFEYENRNRTSAQPTQQRPAQPSTFTQQERRQPLPYSPDRAQRPLFAPPLQRQVTPDPFEVDHSPSEYEASHGYQHDPYSPTSSAFTSQAGMRTTLGTGSAGSKSRLPLSQRMPSDTMLRSGAPVSVLEPPMESDEEDAEDSQLFPGSDLF